MRIGHAGETVDAGLWLETRTWRLHLQEKGDGPLPGATDSRYVRVPTAVGIVLAPLAGLAYVVLLPVVGVALAARQLFGRAHSALARAARRRAAPSHRG